MDVHRDRGAILSLMERLSEADRAMVPDLLDTVDRLYAKASDLGRALNDLDTSFDSMEIAKIDMKLAEIRTRPEWEERDRRFPCLSVSAIRALTWRHDGVRCRSVLRAARCDAEPALRFVAPAEKVIGAVGVRSDAGLLKPRAR